jgi:Cu2+-exporting ATPase
LKERGFAPAVVEQIAEEQGKGVHGLYQGQRVALERPAEDMATEGAATRLVMGDTHVDILLADTLRPDATNAIALLAALNVPASIVSGDREEAVASVAATLGLPSRAHALPQDKITAIHQLQAEGHMVLMVGDGLNDGPALAAANASLAPGSATDMGQQAADAVFTGDSLSAVPAMINASRRTMRVVRENFVLAVGYNVLAVPLAILGYVTPLLAAIAMSTSSVIVIANALRLRSCAR